ncbi:MAG: hypothetical protein ACRERU_24000 [Methylococcales bacterium]
MHIRVHHPVGGFQPCKLAIVADLSLNADFTLAARDRGGLELALLLRSAHFLQRAPAGQIETDRRLVYRLPKSKPDGQTGLYLTPWEFLDQRAVLIPPAREHRHRYCPAFRLRMHRYAKR